MEIPFYLNPISLEEGLMNKETYVPVIYCSPAIYFALFRIFRLSSRLTSLPNTDEVGPLPLNNQSSQLPLSPDVKLCRISIIELNRYAVDS